ncbi:MAG: hypothetical protein ABEI80_08475 [Haloplanus sp.]
MPTKQIRVSESYHAYLKSKQREDETLGETAERLGRDFSLVEWAEEMAEVADEHWDPDELEEQLEADDRENLEQLEEELP